MIKSFNQMENDSSGVAFDSRIETLKRINKVIERCNLSSMMRDYDSWKTAIYNLERELCPWMNEEDIRNINAIYVSINEKQIKINKAKTGSLQKPIWIGEMMSLLHEAEKILRRIHKEKGMALPSKANPEFIFVKR